jgi:hypothetical protein
MCVERTEHASGDEISAPLPAGRLGRGDRRLESALGWWLGQGPLVLLRDGGKGEELNPNLLLRSREYSHARRACGRWSDTDVEEGWCDNIEEEHRWREYEKARIPAP